MSLIVLSSLAKLCFSCLSLNLCFIQFRLFYPKAEHWTENCWLRHIRDTAVAGSRPKFSVNQLRFHCSSYSTVTVDCTTLHIGHCTVYSVVQCIVKFGFCHTIYGKTSQECETALTSQFDSLKFLLKK